MGFFAKALKNKTYRSQDAKVFLASKASLIDFYNKLSNVTSDAQQLFSPMTTLGLDNSGLKASYNIENGKLCYVEELVLNGEVSADPYLKYQFLSKDENGNYKYSSVTLIADDEIYEEPAIKYEFEDESGYHQDVILQSNLSVGIHNYKDEINNCLIEINNVNAVRNELMIEKPSTSAGEIIK